MTPIKRPDHYSPTALIQYGGGGLYIRSGCPAWYAAERIDSVDPVEGESCAAGRIYADIMAAYRRHCYATDKPSDPDAMVGFIDGYFWQQADVAAGMYWEIRELCERTAYNEVLDLDAFYDVEDVKTLAINDHVFRLRPDLVYVKGATGLVLDDKTGWHEPTDEQVKSDFQLKCYAAAVLEEAQAIECCKVAFRLPRLNRTSAMHVYWRDQLYDIKDEIWKRIEQIEADIEFLPRPGSCCAFCGVKKVCPALAARAVEARGGVVVAPVVSDEQADEYVARLVSYMAMAKDIKDALRPYVKLRKRPASFSDMAFGPHDEVQTSYPPKALHALFDGTETDPWSVLSVDKNALKKALKHEQQLAGEVAALAQTTTKTKTDLHRIGAGEDD